MTFAEFGFSAELLSAISKQSYVEPTPIQAQAIPPALAGKDVLGLAQTGTGKTAAFALPLLHRIAQSGRKNAVQALILAPTRELCDQIRDVVDQFAQPLGLRSVTLYGGVSAVPQVQRLRQGAEIAIACPGRLIDHLSQRTIDLSKLQVVVLDEADRMFDMGFLPDIRRIAKQLPAQRQSLFFSATMPREIRALAHELLSSPVTVEVAHSMPASTITHALYPVAPHLKTPLLEQLLKTVGPGSVLVFTRTKHRAKKLAENLKRAQFSVTSLQGNLSQNRRQEAMEGFRKGTYQVLVATDIASRGIDISTVTHVINYDIPDTVEAYTHRIGRTGRATRTGDAFTLTSPEDNAMVRTIERVLGYNIECKTLSDFDYTRAAARSNEFARAPRPPRQSHGSAPRRDHRGPRAQDDRRPRRHSARPAGRSAQRPAPRTVWD